MITYNGFYVLSFTEWFKGLNDRKQSDLVGYARQFVLGGPFGLAKRGVWVQTYARSYQARSYL